MSARPLPEMIFLFVLLLHNSAYGQLRGGATEWQYLAHGASVPTMRKRRLKIRPRLTVIVTLPHVSPPQSSRHRCSDRLQCRKCQWVVVQYASSRGPRGVRISSAFPHRDHSTYTVPQHGLRYLDTNCCPTNNRFHRPFTGIRRAYHQRYPAPAGT